MFRRLHRYCFGDFYSPGPPEAGTQLKYLERTGTDKGKPLEREGRKAADLRLRRQRRGLRPLGCRNPC